MTATTVYELRAVVVADCTIYGKAARHGDTVMLPVYEEQNAVELACLWRQQFPVRSVRVVKVVTTREETDVDLVC